MKWIVLATVICMYFFVIVFQDRKVWFTSAAALFVVALGVIFPNTIFPLPQSATSEFASRVYAITHSLSALINWNVLMIYIGSMTIAALFIYSKVPALIADSIVDNSPNTGIAIVAILAMTGIISIFVENVATVLVMAPIALALCKKLKIDPTFFMVGLAVMSNLEGTATLVGDPPSMIFASYAGYTFNDFFIHNGRLSIFFIVQMGMIAGCLYFYFVFAHNGGKKVSVVREPAISWFPAILLLAMIFGLAGISFIKTDFGYLSGLYVLILGVAGVIWYALQPEKNDKTLDMVKTLDWETILFLTGIFVVVGAISETGLLNEFANVIAIATSGNVLLGFLIILGVSILISGFVDNVPYIIIMLPVADTLARTLGLRPELYMFALLVGSCLGGNLTPFGASANIVAMGILKKEGKPMNFVGWLKIGLPFTLITTGSASILLWILWAH